MPSTHTSLHYHLIFATKNREPTIDSRWRNELHAYLGGIIKGLGAFPQGIGGVANHVHLLVSLKSTHCLADFMRELKKASSAWIRDSRLPVFEWQEGYAAFSVSASSRDAVRQCISNQEAHHRVKSFRDELIEFLRKSDTDFNPRYLD